MAVQLCVEWKLLVGRNTRSDLSANLRYGLHQCSQQRCGRLEAGQTRSWDTIDRARTVSPLEQLHTLLFVKTSSEAIERCRIRGSRKRVSSLCRCGDWYATGQLLRALAEDALRMKAGQTVHKRLGPSAQEDLIESSDL